jgi:hypothetical protein
MRGRSAGERARSAPAHGAPAHEAAVDTADTTVAVATVCTAATRVAARWARTETTTTANRTVEADQEHVVVTPQYACSWCSRGTGPAR